MISHPPSCSPLLTLVDNGPHLNPCPVLGHVFVRRIQRHFRAIPSQEPTTEVQSGHPRKHPGPRGPLLGGQIPSKSTSDAPALIWLASHSHTKVRMCVCGAYFFWRTNRSTPQSRYSVEGQSVVSQAGGFPVLSRPRKTKGQIRKIPPNKSGRSPQSLESPKNWKDKSGRTSLNLANPLSETPRLPALELQHAAKPTRGHITPRRFRVSRIFPPPQTLPWAAPTVSYLWPTRTELSRKVSENQKFLGRDISVICPRSCRVMEIQITSYPSQKEFCTLHIFL